MTEKERKPRPRLTNAMRQVVGLLEGEMTPAQVLQDIKETFPNETVGALEAYLANIDNTFLNSFGGGEPYDQLRALRKELQGQLERYSSLEFKKERLDDFLAEVKERIVERMQAAHPKRGNAWLWEDNRNDRKEELIDHAAFTVIDLKKLELSGLIEAEDRVNEMGIEPEEGKTSLESKLDRFPVFMEQVKAVIARGDVAFGKNWLSENLPRLIKGELLDQLAYAYFEWYDMYLEDEAMEARKPTKKQEKLF